MLLLVTVGLVVVALALLIIGFVQHALSLIYLSIACSAAAALTLIVFNRVQRRRSLRLGASVAVELGAGGAQGTPGGAAPAAGAAIAGDEETTPVAALAEAASPPAPAGARVPGADSDAEGSGFPIADYGRLRSADILAHLGGLDGSELLAVKERELAGRARRTVLRRIDSLLAAPAVAGDRAPAPAPEGTAAGGNESAGAVFPIADYDELRVSEITPLLSQLYPDELVVVAAREREGANRSTVLRRIDRLLAAAERTGRPGGGTARGGGGAPAPGPAPGTATEAGGGGAHEEAPGGMGRAPRRRRSQPDAG